MNYQYNFKGMDSFVSITELIVSEFSSKKCEGIMKWNSKRPTYNMKKIILGSWFAIMKSDIFYNIIQECIIVSKIITDVIQAQWCVS